MTDRAAFEDIVLRLQTAWNAMDGEAFAAPFAAQADFVNIRGEHFQGRAEIAAGHVGLFQGIYAGSTNQLTVEDARVLRPRLHWCGFVRRSRCRAVRSPAGMERGSRWW